MSDLVTIQMMSDNDKQLMAKFYSSGVPEEANYTMVSSESGKDVKLKALDLRTNMNYIGNELDNKYTKYHLAVRENNVLKVYPLSIYNMNPIIQMNDNMFETPLTIKEQMDEMKEKFGSRRSQRQLSSKRKYALEFGADDVEGIEVQTKSSQEVISSQSSSETTANDSIDILPKQNRDSICAEEVYDLNEIIVESERHILKPLSEELFDSIDSPFIKSLISSGSDSEQKLIAIYINLIIKLVNLKVTELRSVDPLPTLDNDVKEFLFNRYLTQSTVGNKTKYLLSPKQKDRLIIYGIILCLILYKFRPIDMELLQKSFKIHLKQLNRIVEIIGCYVENMKNSSGVNIKSCVLRVPLNTFQEKTKKRFSGRKQ